MLALGCACAAFYWVVIQLVIQLIFLDAHSGFSNSQSKIMFIELILVHYLSAVVGSSRPEAKTPYGRVRGVEMESYHGRAISAFYNIPYAQTLNPRRRFEEPKDPDPWHTVLEAGGPPVACPQVSLSNEFKGVENCLVLNIFSPVAPNTSFSAQLFPVIVYIHGGAYYFLSSGEYGPRYILDHDVVLVTMNFRIGIPGFGSTEDHILPGNLGLKDQIKALKWIQRNIHLFNGDRKSVTLVGMSSGAACVHFHYFSKLSKGLFHKGVMIGGTGTQPWSMLVHPRMALKKISKNIGCPTNSSFDMVVCLEQLSPKELAMSIRTIQKNNVLPLSPVGAVVDDHSFNPFLVEYPYDSLHYGRVQNLPLLISNVKMEGIFPGLLITGDENALKDLNKDWYSQGVWLLELKHDVPDVYLNITLKKIREYYFGDRPIDKSFSINMLNMLSDRYFLTQSMKSVALHARFNPLVYYYIFDYRGGQSSSQRLTENSDLYGASHIDDLFYMFNVTNRRDLERNSTDLLMIRRMTTMLVSFAKTGIPSFDTDVTFLPVKKSTSVYGPVRALVIKSPDNMEITDLENWGNIQFWESLPLVTPRKNVY